MNDILLYSSGLDSFILWHLYPHVQPVYFDLGLRYSKFEIAHVRKINSEYATQHGLKHIKVVKVGFYDKADETEGGYIPYRNLILMLKGAMAFQPDNIYFGVVCEWQRDKSKPFFRLVEYLIHNLGSKQGYRTKIRTPFYRKNKSTILKMYLKDHSIEPLLKYSRSCITNEPKECGTCINCQRKYTALLINGIDTDRIFTDTLKVSAIKKQFITRTFKEDFKWQKVIPAIGRFYELGKAKQAEKRHSS